MKTIVKTFLICLFLVNCSDSSHSEKGVSSVRHEMADAPKMMKESSNVENDEISSEKIERKLIKRGSIAFETDDLSTTRKNIEQAVEKFDAYISSDNESKNSYEVTSNVTVRIPSKNFDGFLAEIASKVDKFESKNISVDDVTEQFLDVQARLKVKKSLEERYSELLKKTKSVKEVLEVERELTKVRSDIESMEGRLKYLQNQVSFSTLDIRFYKVEVVQSSSKSFWRRLANAFNNGIDGIKWFFLSLVSIWPFILIGIGVFLFIKRRSKTSKN